MVIECEQAAFVALYNEIKERLPRWWAPPCRHVGVGLKSASKSASRSIHKIKGFI